MTTTNDIFMLEVRSSPLYLIGNIDAILKNANTDDFRKVQAIQAAIKTWEEKQRAYRIAMAEEGN